MENASKALIMAGSVLVAMIVISVLVIFFGNLRDLQNVELTEDEAKKMEEFNKQYDVYARDVYGSEILSLANRIDNYNKTQAENEGYTKIEIYVTLTDNIDETYFKKGTYSSAQLRTEIKNLENKVEELGKEKIKSKTQTGVSRQIKKLAAMRTNEIEALGFETSQYQYKLRQYNTYKSLVTEFKAKEFKYDKFEYDKYNGRITKMYYKL